MSLSGDDPLSSGGRPTEEEMGFFFDLSLDLLCVANFAGRFIRLNPAWEDALGQSRDELMSVPYVTFIHPDDVAATEAEAQKISEGAVTLLFANRYRRKDGSYLWLQWHAKPDLERGLIYASARDITQQKMLEQQLIETSRLQRAILDSANFTIISGTPEGTIQTFNAAAERELGYKADEVIGKAAPAMFHDPQEVVQRAEALSRELGRPIEPGFESFVAKARLGPPDESEWTYIRKDGSRYPVLLSVTALRDASGEISGFLGVGSNITERKRAESARNEAEDDLRRSNEALEQFAYVASHDLQEPLRIVISYLQLLERRHMAQLNEEAREFIKTAVTAASRMRALIQDLLAFSRIGRRGKPLVLVDANAALDAALANLKLAIEESGAVIHREGNLPLVLSDELRLSQVFQNLVGNAIKFCGAAPPSIHVGARREKGWWILHVKDEGIGLEAKFFDRIFEIFQRLETRNDGGTGIGLAICKRIIEGHGGRIWVESAPGAGSTFFFALHGTGNASSSATQ